ncbi:surface lipoprotein assembly modifier [Neisseria cinerea]|uniref:Tetratricopeptide repeat protein n=1 Tax=Neisseria cinerea ATCC 14685 TaxID=546262 RepID=D0W4V8_NEICI|nr:surface lipoprotein assembly modifier [Neisseria cinerea]EEZ71253.1 hypothetical protein NEICINOT_04706 [Neisseria cinerea ATCC 14685]MCD2071360.1 surface lipoprotein assembly modifier [Neisseria cinerea]
MNKLSLLLLPFPLAALADGPTVLVPEPLFFENREAAQMPSENLPDPAPAAPLSDGLSPQDGLEAQINHAVFRRDWQALPPLLARYRNLPARDQTLYDYALGALRRAQLRHKEAIALYRGIVGRHPDLAYPRFDLGVMLFEDRQYRAAEAELQHALPDLSPEMQNIAGRYLAAVREAESWQPDVSLQYEATDNVNNAADARFIEIDGKRWQKTADSLPQRAHGLRYGASVSREKNLGGHHYAYAKLGGDGVAYWDNHDFDEQSLNIAAGYKNHSAARSFGLVPFAETNWLGGSRYNRADGVQADFSRRFGAKWRVMLNAGYVRKHYREPHIAERYNGKMPLAGVTLMYAAPKGWLFYGGADWSHEMTKETEQASVRKGIRFGAVKAFENGFGIRTNLRYARRTFDAPDSLVYRLTRKDHEYQANVSIWHNKISWKGLVPHLNFRYLKIDSNMSGFYSRKSMQTFVSVEKQF